jgi:hypothetical protein
MVGDVDDFMAYLYRWFFSEAGGEHSIEVDAEAALELV